MSPSAPAAARLSPRLCPTPGGGGGAMWNFNTHLARLEEQGRPIRVGLIGSGRFGTMIMAQVSRMKGMRISVVADLSEGNTRKAVDRAGMSAAAIVRADTTSRVNEAIQAGNMAITEDSLIAIESDVDVIVEATGLTEPGARHAYQAISNGKHIVMVNVETDVLVGPLLKSLADQASVTYTLAYGDQPALIKELYDWATALGYEVVAAGKGSKYSPDLRKSTPDTVWTLYGHTEEEVQRAGLNAKMYNSFLDSTKSAVEMVSVSNMTGLVPDVRGMHFPPVPTPEIPSVFCPKEDGGILSRTGVVDVVSSTFHDGSAVEDSLRWGVFIVVASDNAYLRNTMAEYGVATGGGGKYALMYRPYHFVGMETPLSIASAVIRHEPTGAPAGRPVSEVIAAAKRSLSPGEVLDGEGGYTLYGMAETAPTARSEGLLPMGLANRARVVRPIAEDAILSYEDVALDEDSFAFKLRRLQDDTLAPVKS